MTTHPAPDGRLLVVHVIPTPLGRGAQRAARILVDRLDDPGGTRHLLVGLFDGAPEVRVDLTLAHPGAGRPAEGFDLRLARRLRSTLRRLGPAVVVAHGGDPMKYVSAALVGSARPVVYCVIGTYAGPPSAPHVALWRVITARADRVVAVGDEVLEECVRRFHVDPRRAVMIPNGRDPARFYPRPSGAGRGSDPMVLFVGALTDQKRPDLFVEVVRHLRDQGRSFRATLVGGGPLAAPLANAASGSGVELLGPRDDVAELLRGADVLVFPSRPTGEGMPGVLIEAGLSGVPVVATRTPGVATVVADGQTGIIVDGTVGPMAAAVGALLDDPERRAAMGGAARTRCTSEFTLEVMADRWRDVLSPLLDAQVRTGRAAPLPDGARSASALRRRIRALRGSSHS